MCSSCCWSGRWRSLARAAARARRRARRRAVRRSRSRSASGDGAGDRGARRRDRVALDRARRASADTTAAFGARLRGGDARAVRRDGAAGALRALPPAMRCRSCMSTAAGIGGFGLALLTAGAALGIAVRTRLAGAARAGEAARRDRSCLAFPACLGDPYAHLDPRLATLWLVQRERGAQHRQPCCAICRRRCCPITVCRARARARPLSHAVRERDDATLGLDRRHRRCSRRSTPSRSGRCAAARPPMRVALAMVPAALVRGLPAPSGRAVFLGLGRAALDRRACCSIRSP